MEHRPNDFICPRCGEYIDGRIALRQGRYRESGIFELEVWVDIRCDREGCGWSGTRTVHTMYMGIRHVTPMGDSIDPFFDEVPEWSHLLHWENKKLELPCVDGCISCKSEAEWEARQGNTDAFKR